jgi:hypothetical protein
MALGYQQLKRMTLEAISMLLLQKENKNANYTWYMEIKNKKIC